MEAIERRILRFRRMFLNQNPFIRFVGNEKKNYVFKETSACASICAIFQAYEM